MRNFVRFPLLTQIWPSCALEGVTTRVFALGVRSLCLDGRCLEFAEINTLWVCNGGTHGGVTSDCFVLDF